MQYIKMLLMSANNCNMKAPKQKKNLIYITKRLVKITMLFSY